MIGLYESFYHRCIEFTVRLIVEVSRIRTPDPDGIHLSGGLSLSSPSTLVKRTV